MKEIVREAKMPKKREPEQLFNRRRKNGRRKNN